MITCFMFGKYTAGALKEISADRTHKALMVIEEQGGKIKAMYALLGDQDLIFIADFPDVNHAIKASVTLTDILGISFSTSPAVTVEEFDAMMADM